MDLMWQRSSFEKAVQMFSNALGESVEDVIEKYRPCGSQLRLEQPAITTSTLYTFPIKITQAQTITETRLVDTNSFVPYMIGFYLANPTGAADDAYTDFSYCNQFIFPAAMKGAYLGKLEISIGQVKYLVNWPLRWHECRPETMQTAAFGAGSPEDQFDGQLSGKVGMNPFLILGGTKNISVNIQLTNAFAAILANSRLVVTLDGVEFQNITIVA